VREIALHLLDIAENSVAAQAATVTVSVCENLYLDRLIASVTDDGRGMDARQAAQVIDPFVTSRTTRNVGLGIPLLKMAAEACNGCLEIASTPGKGTCLTVEFQREHIDRMPLGDLVWTFLNLLVAHPEVHWVFRYQGIGAAGSPEETFEFDDQPVKETLSDIPLTEPAVLTYLREELEQGIANIQQFLKENTNDNR
jgi:hypothetical protein